MQLLYSCSRSIHHDTQQKAALLSAQQLRDKKLWTPCALLLLLLSDQDKALWHNTERGCHHKLHNPFPWIHAHFDLWLTTMKNKSTTSKLQSIYCEGKNNQPQKTLKTLCPGLLMPHCPVNTSSRLGPFVKELQRFDFTFYCYLSWFQQGVHMADVLLLEQQFKASAWF